MYSDNKMVLQLISLLKQFDIRRIVISPGSRHFAFVHSIEADPYFKLYSVVDERSAAFFALGLIQQSGEVVAVTCSSGTACINYGSAIVEAYYQRLPLLVLSSDRLPKFLDQREDQMYDQLSTFTNCTKYHVQLPVINTDADLWYCNRLINEAFIELNHHGKGPVHVNIPFLSHNTDTFSTVELPAERKISLHDAETPKEEWKQLALQLKDKKIAIVWGQSVKVTSEMQNTINKFCDMTDAVILTDLISNLHNPNAIINTSVVLTLMTKSEKERMKPEIVISVGGNTMFNPEIKAYANTCKNWQVGKEDKVMDGFHSLTDIFEMSESYFFSKFTEYADIHNKTDYRKSWQAISSSLSVPVSKYNELYVIGALMTHLPEDADLQLANSLTIRMSQMFRISPNIRVNCNRGVNGIDGSMSTAVGFSADNDRMTFYITGDLSFFYDMNSLGIRHISHKMRVLLINNHGGGVMYLPLDEEKRKTLPEHIAAGHNLCAKGWVESLGFKYISASTKDEVDACVMKLIDPNINVPVVFEVFTTINPDDISAMRDYFQSADRRSETEIMVSKVKNKIKLFLGK